MDMITAAAISPIPTMQDYVASGGKPEEYNAFVDKKKAELEAQAFEAARSQSKKTVRVRVVGNGWRPGQTDYKVLAKAPFDSRIPPGQPGYENPYKPEPPLSLRIGQVTEVPIRDERHLALLKSDVNLQFVEDSVPTHQEEKSIVDAAVAKAKAGGPLTSGVSPAPTTAAPAPAKDPLQLPEAEALALISAEGSVPKLLGWLAAADAAKHGPLADAVEDQLGELGDLVSDAMERRLSPEERQRAAVAREEDRAAQRGPVDELRKRLGEVEAELAAAKHQVEELLLTKPPAVGQGALPPKPDDKSQQGQPPKKK